MAEVVSTLLLFVPLLVIMWSANLADRHRPTPQPTLIAVSYTLLFLLYGALFLGGLFLQAAGRALQAGNLPRELVTGYQDMGADPAMVREIVDSLPLIGLGLWLPALVGMALVSLPVRRLLARLIPIDVTSTVHAVALAYTMLAVINLTLTLGIGLDNLSDIMAAGDEGGVGSTLATVWAQNIAMALLALVGVGWLSRRDWPATLERLGVCRPSGRDVMVGVGLALALVPLVMGLEYLASLTGYGFDPDVERLTEQLLGPLFQSVPGILTIGLAAALGEELIFRGALQPRLGLPLTALLFALTHSNYGITLSTLVVFALGLVLGWARRRFNTSTSMVIHAVYNMALGFLAYLSLHLPQGV